MFTIVASSTTMSWAMPTTPRISHRRLSGAAPARAAGGPGRPTTPVLVLVLFIALAYLEVLRRLPCTDASGWTARRRRAQEAISAWSAGMRPGAGLPRGE